MNHRIFNADSLPQGTDVSKVLCSVTALNNGGVFVEDLKEEGSLLFVSDSIDFSVTSVSHANSAYMPATVVAMKHTMSK